MDLTLAGLRALRETAERGTVTAAAEALGFTQSALSRQISALERAAGTPLFERHAGGLRLTHEGRILLRHGKNALEEMDIAVRALRGGDRGGRVRLGVFVSAGAVLLPRTLRSLRHSRPDLEVTSRVSTTPSLVRSLRAGTLDLVVVTSRPPHRPFDAESPALTVQPLAESRLRIAVPADGPLADRDFLELDDLADQPWIVTPSRSEEPQLGTWPSLPGRPRIAHTAHDWSAKLQLVAAGCGITTVPPIITPAVPAGVRVLPVADGPRETRRVAAAWLPDSTSGPLRDVLHALTEVAAELAEGD